MRKKLIEQRKQEKEPKETIVNDISYQVYTMDRHNGFKERILRYLQDLWNKGKLPEKRGNKWLVGFYIRKDFFQGSVMPIYYVGPMKPRKFKIEYNDIEVDDSYVSWR